MDLSNDTFTLCTAANPCPTPTPAPSPVPTPQGYAIYWADGQIVDGYYYDDEDDTADPSNSIKPGNPIETIKVLCRYKGADLWITFTNDKANNRVFVEFDEKRFVQRTPTGMKKALARRTGKKVSIESVLVNGGTENGGTTTDFHGKKWTLVLVGR